MNVLAIDDVHDNLLTLQAMLKVFLPEANLKVASSAADGIAIAKSDQPDVILLDIQMPIMDGFEATRQLKSDAATQHIPIVLITAHLDNSGCKVKGLDCGADAFLSKPIEEVELVAQIKAMFRIKKSEDALRAERDNLEALVAERLKEVYEKQHLNQLLLDAIPHFTYLINLDRKIISLNRMALHKGTKVGDYCWLGIHKPMAISSHQNEQHFLKTGESLPGTICSFCLADKAMSTNKTEYTEVELHGVYWDVWWIPVNNSMYLHYAVDITDRKKAEEEKSSLEKQLFHAQKLESIGTLAGGIAHDFNNILTVISGYAALLQRSLANDQDNLSMANEIIKSSDRASEMTNSLLMFSSKQTLELRPDTLRQIIIGLSKTLKRLIREDIVIVSEISDDELPIIADRVQVEQLVINLVVNARDAIQAEGRITLKTEMIVANNQDLIAYGVDAPGKYAMLTVSDTGLGMDSQTLEHIFEPFFTTKELGKGTGLGLSISYAIVRKHNGAIVVQSHPGQGTTFKISLPIREQSSKLQQNVIKSGCLSGNETILVVEDESAVSDMIKRILENYGYHVMVADDGESGLFTYKNNQDTIKMVISDVIMPNKNGMEMSREIRLLNATVPIILMSGYTNGLLDKGNILNDKEFFVQKPIKPDYLLNVVRRVLNDPDCLPDLALATIVSE